MRTKSDVRLDGTSIDRRLLLIKTGSAAIMGTFSTFNPANADEPSVSPAETLRRITEPGAGDNRATYMPDGHTILFASSRSGNSQIWSMTPDGTGPQLFHKSAANDYGRVAPNSTGTRICFSSDRDGQNSIYILSLADASLKQISDATYWSFGPCWSSRDLIAYFSKKGGNGINIWTVRPDGSDERQITNQPGESRQPWWSPDGKALAIAADQGTGLFQIWLVGWDGANAHPITNPGIYEQPFWSPDGKRIAVSARLDGKRRQIYLIELDGLMLRSIRQPEDTDNVHPAWSPDGRSLVFTSGNGLEGSLWRYDFP